MRKSDDEVTYCVACGRPVERAASGLPDHHCPARVEGCREGQHRRACEEPRHVPRTFSQRLAEGFEILNQDDD